MRSIKLAAGAVAAAAGLGLAGAAGAAVIDWTLSNGTFDDGGTFSGTFSFDSASDAITAWNVTTTGALGATYSSPGGCIFVFCSSASDNGSGPTFGESFIFFSTTFALTGFNLPAGPGTVASLGGTESGVVVDFSDFEPIEFSRAVTGGSAVGVLATPEPATWTMMIAGFGLAGASLRLRRRVMAAG